MTSIRAVVQRVKRARVTVEGQEVGAIGPGLLVFLGVARGDDERDVAYMADKVANLRIFADGEGKMNLSVRDTGGRSSRSPSSPFAGTAVKDGALVLPKRPPQNWPENYTRNLLPLSRAMGLR